MLVRSFSPSSSLQGEVDFALVEAFVLEMECHSSSGGFGVPSAPRKEGLAGKHSRPLLTAGRDSGLLREGVFVSVSVLQLRQQSHPHSASLSRSTCLYRRWCHSFGTWDGDGHTPRTRKLSRGRAVAGRAAGDPSALRSFGPEPLCPAGPELGQASAKASSRALPFWAWMRTLPPWQ